MRARHILIAKTIDQRLTEPSVELLAAAAAFRDNSLDQEKESGKPEENLVAVLVIFHTVAALVLLFKCRNFGQDLLQLELARACVKIKCARHICNFL